MYINELVGYSWKFIKGSTGKNGDYWMMSRHCGITVNAWRRNADFDQGNGAAGHRWYPFLRHPGGPLLGVTHKAGRFKKQWRDNSGSNPAQKRYLHPSPRPRRPARWMPHSPFTPRWRDPLRW
jgi:hypothetical protein